MKYLSVCSGIEAATVAWHPLGWEAVGFSEIEKFPSEVLKHHYPHVTNFGDMTKFKEWELGTNINVFVGGTPCQSFSVAGLRKGLDDPRGNLMLTYLAIANKLRPKWLVWENVPGVLSSNNGKDFATFLGGLAECGYGFAYRVLDAQYFGVAQRRRRVFVVGYLGDWRAAAAVLFERESLQGNPPPRREQGQEVAGTIAARFGISRNNHEECVATFDRQSSGEYGTAPVASTISARDYKGATDLVYSLQGAGSTSKTANGSGWNEEVSFTLNSTDVHGVAQPIVLMDQGGSIMNVLQDGTVGTLRRETHGHEPVVMQPMVVHGTQDPCVSDIAFAQGTNNGGENVVMQSIVAPTLTASNDPSRSPQSTEVTNQIAAVHAASMAVRRLTPVECERLQGFPDGYTNIKENCPDGPRYKALGNSMAVPVMQWIGKRIEQYEQQNNSL